MRTEVSTRILGPNSLPWVETHNGHSLPTTSRPTPSSRGDLVRTRPTATRRTKTPSTTLPMFSGTSQVTERGRGRPPKSPGPNGSGRHLSLLSTRVHKRRVKGVTDLGVGGGGVPSPRVGDGIEYEGCELEPVFRVFTIRHGRVGVLKSRLLPRDD